MTYTLRRGDRRYIARCDCGWESEWMPTPSVAGPVWDDHVLDFCSAYDRRRALEVATAEHDGPVRSDGALDEPTHVIDDAQERWNVQADRLLAVLDAGEAMTIRPDMSLVELDALIAARDAATRAGGSGGDPRAHVEEHRIGTRGGNPGPGNGLA